MIQDPSRSLSKIELLKNIHADEISAIEARCGWRHFTPHEQIIDRNSESRDVYFISQGSVRIINYSISGREISFDDINAGDIFGEFSAIDDKPRSANVIAMKDTVVANMSPMAFQEIIIAHPNIALTLLKRLANINRKSNERIMELSTLGANNRVYAELLRLTRAQTGDSTTPTISPFPNHSDIASRVSTSRETVSRVFGELTKNGMIAKSGRTLEILDIKRLQKMVEYFHGD